MQLLYTIFIVLQVLIGFNLFFPSLLSAFYLVSKWFGKHVSGKGRNGVEADYAIIVTAYEQTDFLPAVVNSLLSMKYSNYIIYIVADNCDVSRLDFADDKVVLLRPDNVIANNVGSHFYAIDRFIRPHERLTIIDSDNIVDAEYLNKLNYYFDKGYNAVQGVRQPANLNSVYACLDAARDKYYHFYDGKMLFFSGSSATLSGSGMAFTTALYKECLEHLTIEGAGFDKVLQYEIVKRNERIAFAEEAYLFDEKTSKPEQLVAQRARWINTWFKYSYFGVRVFWKGVVNGSWNQVLFGVVLLRPPLFMFLLASVISLLVNLFVSPLAVYLWACGLGLFLLNFFVALTSSDTDKRIYSSLINIPKFIYYQLLSLVKVGAGAKYTVATKHNVEDINSYEK